MDPVSSQHPAQRLRQLRRRPFRLNEFLAFRAGAAAVGASAVLHVQGEGDQVPAVPGGEGLDDDAVGVRRRAFQEQQGGAFGGVEQLGEVVVGGDGADLAASSGQADTVDLFQELV